MEHSVDWYAGLVRDLEVDFRPRNNLFSKIDDMVRPTWTLPTAFTEVVKNVMAIVDTAPSDAINSGAIALSGSNPIFNVSPFVANVAEYDRVQALEDNLGFHFRRSNKRGNGTLMYDIADSSLRYNTICVRTDDLAHILPRDTKKWTQAQRRSWSYGRFINKVIHPANVYYYENDAILSMVAHVQSYRIMDLIKYWEQYANGDTDEARRISATLTNLKNEIGYSGNNGDKFRDTRFMQTYCIDDEKLMIWGSVVNIQNAEALYSKPDHIFAEQKNPYGFINWSIRVAGSRLEDKMEYRVNPLLAPLYWSGLWDKLNLAKSVIYSEPIRRAQTPRMATFTQGGEAPEIDYQNGGDINMRAGEDVKGLQPITLDAGAMAIVGQLESAMNRTTGASMIGDTTKISSNTPFATFSAMVKVALSRLEKQRDIMARSCEDIACNMLWWVDKTDVPLTAYAESNKQYRSGTVVPAGRKTEITKTDYNLNSLGISVKVRASTPTDEMEQLNKAVILSTKLNVPASQLLEEMGYENVGLMYELYTREFIQNAQLQAQAQGMIAEAQGMAQASVQQQMQQAQQPAGAGGGIANTSFGQLGSAGQGMNPAMQGMSPTQMAPTVTRENVTQRNYSQEG